MKLWAAGYKLQAWSLRADVAQLVEHSLGKGEVTSSILVISSRNTVVGDQWTVVSWSSGEESGAASICKDVLITGH